MSMDQLSTDMTEQVAPERSTQLNPQNDAPAANAPEEGDNAETKEARSVKETRLETIKRAAEDVEKAVKPEPAKEEAKDAPKEPAEKAEAEPAKAEEKPEAPKETEEARAERQKRPIIEPHPKMLPRARELWVNVPHEVRSEVARITAEAEQEAEQAREATKEFEAVKPFAEMARQSGTTLDQALNRYVQMEQTLRQDPTAGMRNLIQNMGMTPQQAIGHIAAAFNVTPDRLGQHMMADPNAYTALAPQSQARQQVQSDPKVERLEQQIAQMRAEQQANHVTTNIIEPFARENPRYYELQPTIASFLKSDMIPASLSAYDRLAAAYDMAVRISPSAPKAQPASDLSDALAPDGRAGNDFGGNKSVRGAPASGVDISSRRKGKMSRGEAIEAALSELGIAH